MARTAAELKQYYHDWYLRNRDRRRVQQHKWWLANKERHDDNQRIRRYGVPRGWYKARLEKQGGKCAICKQPPIGRQNLDVDHCHRTGKARGLLCSRCNTTLARLEEIVGWDILAQEYLSEF